MRVDVQQPRKIVSDERRRTIYLWFPDKRPSRQVEHIRADNQELRGLLTHASQICTFNSPGCGCKHGERFGLTKETLFLKLKGLIKNNHNILIKND